MALSRINGHDELYVGGIWALRRSDSLTERRITHVLSMVGFNPSNLKNFKDEPWSHYGKGFEHLLIDIDDVDDADLLIELPRAVRFIHAGLSSAQSEASKNDTASGVDSSDLGAGIVEQGVKSSDQGSNTDTHGGKGGVFVHCAAGKSRSVAVTIAYLLWRHPNLFDPNIVGAVDADAPPPPPGRTRKETAHEAVRAALLHIRRTRPMADPNDGFMRQLELWWEMGCPADKDVESHPAYQRWAYQREVDESLAVGQAPSRLRFEDEQAGGQAAEAGGLNLRCKKCRRSLATSPYILKHTPSGQSASAQCPHFYVEPLSWMRGELEKGELGGRLLCPGARCGANVGKYEWRGFKCTCGDWVVPSFTLQRGRVDEDVVRASHPSAGDGQAAQQRSLGIRMPPGARNGNL